VTAFAGPRFWLWFEVHGCSYRYEPRSDGKPFRQLVAIPRERHRTTVEVNEATYRQAYNDANGHEATDITLPLDDYWWSDVPVGRWSSAYSVRQCRGGKIDWPDTWPNGAAS
jgi:hypothetical protein